MRLMLNRGRCDGIQDFSASTLGISDVAGHTYIPWVMKKTLMLKVAISGGKDLDGYRDIQRDFFKN